MAKVIASENIEFIKNANTRLNGLSGTSWLSFFPHSHRPRWECLK